MDARLSPFAFSLLAIAALLAPSRQALAQEFRIETDVFVADAEEPASHTVTLFEKSAVYEYVDSPEQVIVYRESGDDKTAVSHDHGRRCRIDADIDVSRVSKLMEKLSTWAADQDDTLLKFSGKPEFRETFDDVTGSLTMASKEWTYRVATYTPDSKDTLKRYRTFTDRYAELNAMISGSPPPGPRLALNAALANHGVVPTEIRRTIGGDEKNVVRAVHTFSWRLSRDDRSKLDQTQKQLASFNKVENEAFIAARTKHDAVRGQSK